MAVFCEAALLDGLRPVFALFGDLACNWCLFGPDVPLKKVARHSGANNDVWIVRIEHCLGDFVLTIQSELWTLL